MNREDAEIKLKRVFGLDHFYDEQWEAIRRILDGERILMIQRTGFGKSLCYQFPATQFSGVTVIFSPLIALMRDQVKALNNKGISARYINSEQSPEENSSTIQDALDGRSPYHFSLGTRFPSRLPSYYQSCETASSKSASFGYYCNSHKTCTTRY